MAEADLKAVKRQGEANRICEGFMGNQPNHTTINTRYNETRNAKSSQMGSAKTDSQYEMNFSEYNRLLNDTPYNEVNDKRRTHYVVESPVKELGRISQQTLTESIARGIKDPKRSEGSKAVE